MLAVVASPYELDVGPTELRPSPAEVADALARVEALGAVELERACGSGIGTRPRDTAQQNGAAFGSQCSGGDGLASSASNARINSSDRRRSVRTELEDLIQDLVGLEVGPATSEVHASSGSETTFFVEYDADTPTSQRDCWWQLRQLAFPLGDRSAPSIRWSRLFAALPTAVRSSPFGRVRCRMLRLVLQILARALVGST